MATPPDYMVGFPSMDESPWVANTQFKLGWITDLFDVANKSMKAIYNEFDSFTLDEEDPLNFDHLDGNIFWEDHASPIVYVAVWAAIALIFTVIGMCWCCFNKCICCCKSSFKDDKDVLESSDPHTPLRPYYSERNSAKYGKNRTGAIVLAVLMGIWLVGFLILIIHSFATTAKIKEITDDINPDIENIFKDVLQYLANVVKQFQFVFSLQFRTFSDKVNDIVDSCPTCTVKTGKVLADIDGLIAALGSAAFIGQSSVARAKTSLEGLRSTIVGVQQGNFKERVKQALDETQKELDATFANFNTAISDVSREAQESKDEVDSEFKDRMNDASNGLFWGFMFFNVLYCIIFVLVLVGTVLAVFARSRNLKVAGYLSYRVAIVMIFILFIIVVTQMLVAFVLGGLVHEIACPAYRKMENGAIPTPLPGPTSTPLPTYEVPGFGTIIRKCKAGNSAYNTFELEKAYDIDKIVGELTDNFNNLLIAMSQNDLKTRISQQLDDVEATLQPLTLANGSNPFDPLYATLRGDVIVLLGSPQTQQNIPPDQAVLEIKNEVDKYAKFITSATKNDIGLCHPMYNAINATIVLFCDKIVSPVSSFWFVLQFIPLVFVLMFVTALFFERFHF